MGLAEPRKKSAAFRTRDTPVERTAELAEITGGSTGHETSIGPASPTIL